LTFNQYSVENIVIVHRCLKKDSKKAWS